MTDKPYFTSLSAMEWPPTRAPPASATFSRAAAHHLAQDIQVRLFRKAHNVQCCFYLAAHGPHVAEGVGGCDLPEGVGSSTMGGKKSRVCTTATSSVSLYTAASSLLSKPMSRFGSTGNFGRRSSTRLSTPAPSLAVQPPPLQKELVLFHGIVPLSLFYRKNSTNPRNVK